MKDRADISFTDAPSYFFIYIPITLSCSSNTISLLLSACPAPFDSLFKQNHLLNTDPAAISSIRSDKRRSRATSGAQKEFSDDTCVLPYRVTFSTFQGTSIR